MQHAARAYKAVANDIVSSRELEADLLLRAAARFQAIYNTWDLYGNDLGGALLFNRKLWTILLTSVTRADNPLPHDIRRNIVSLGIFVLNWTIKLTINPRPEALGTLININRRLASGLQYKR
jgi:flagellar protein FlaF